MQEVLEEGGVERGDGDVTDHVLVDAVEGDEADIEADARVRDARGSGLAGAVDDQVDAVTGDDLGELREVAEAPGARVRAVRPAVDPADDAMAAADSAELAGELASLSGRADDGDPHLGDAARTGPRARPRAR